MLILVDRMENQNVKLSKQHQADALSRAEIRFLNFFNAMNSGIALYHSTDGERFVLTDLNTVGAAVSKVRKEDVIGRDVREVFPGVVEMGLYEIFRRVWTNGKAEMLPSALYKDDRIVNWYENRVFKISDHEIAAVYDDISARIKTEQSLRESESRFHSLFESMHEGFAFHEIICDDTGKAIDYRYLDINPAFERLTGLQRETTIGRTVRELIPGIEDHWITTFGRVALTGEPVEMENHVQDLDRYYNAKAYSPEHGKFAVVFTDVTDQRKLVAALKEHEAKLSVLFESSMAGISMIDPSGKVLLVNNRLAEMLGYSMSELVGSYYTSHLHPDSRAVGEEGLRRLVAGEVDHVSVERHYIRKDGSDFWGYVSVRRHVNSEGKLVSLIGHLTDISELKRSEEERLSLERQLLNGQKLESLGILAGGIAHDFNNILTAIMGNISYARTGLEDSSQAFAPLERAEKAAKRAARLARQLLVFAKGGDPVKHFFFLQQTLTEAVTLVLSGTNIQAVFDLPTDLYAVNADEGQISQAFHNIILNAVQAMPAGGRLFVSGTNAAIAADNRFGLSGGDYVKISIRDEGSGIAQEDLERIFEPYFTSKAAGSGLGLASTYTIIKKHGGQISVSSPPGEGAVFTVLLPGFDDYDPEASEKESVAVNAPGDCSILVMDDDEMIRELAEIILKRLGYKVVSCPDGAKAVSLYRAARDEGAPYSLCIMDLTIPGGMGGIEAARQILAFDPTAKLIVSSGYSEDPVMANFAVYGFCAALEKPYNVKEIARVLQISNLPTTLFPAP